MKYVFLYAGQGSQTVGMGKDFYENFQIYRTVVDSFQTPKDFQKLMYEGPLEELSKTENTQGCMAMFAAGVTEVLKSKGIEPEAACGLSLGEYGALYAAGVFTAKEYIDIVTYRGEQMALAAKGLECCMSAILGTTKEVVEECVNSYAGEGFVTVANYNCVGQYVICGDQNAVEEVEKRLKEKGVRRCMRLNVSGPFHTKYMKPAGDALQKLFADMNFKEPKIPVVLNYTGDFYKRRDNLKDLLVAQVQNSVQMEADLLKLLETGARNFIEIGPGNAVSGFLKKTAKNLGLEVQITNISTVADLERFEKLKRNEEEYGRNGK